MKFIPKYVSRRLQQSKQKMGIFMKDSEKKSLIEELIASTKNGDAKIQKKTGTPRCILRLKRCLEFHLHDREYAKVILDRLSSVQFEVHEKELSFPLNRLISFQPFTERFKNGPVILVGLSGVGKTITAAKLACEALIHKNSVRLVTLDHLKAGSLEQIEKYASALDLKVQNIHNTDELMNFSESVPPQTLQIIDTPAINPFDKKTFKNVLEVVIALKKPPVIVMQAGMDPHETREHLKVFKTMGAKDLIWTKLDCTKYFAGLLTVLADEGWNLLGFSDGPELGKRLISPSASRFATYLEDAMHSSEIIDDKEVA